MSPIDALGRELGEEDGASRPDAGGGRARSSRIQARQNRKRKKNAPPRPPSHKHPSPSAANKPHTHTRPRPLTATPPSRRRRTDFEGYDDDETVRVVLTGNQAPKAVEITAEAMAVGADELSLRLTAAMKDAHGKSVAGMRDKMKGLAASLGLPAGGMGGMGM